MKCPMCSSENISEETEILERSGVILSNKESLLNKPISVVADRARVCFDCGYNMYFSSKKELAKLNNKEVDKVRLKK